MTTNTEKRRAGFEAWFSEKYTDQKLSQRMTSSGFMTGDYSDSRVHLCWRAWNAALDSVCVILPPEWPPISEKDEGANEMLNEIRCRLEAADIPYK